MDHCSEWSEISLYNTVVIIFPLYSITVHFLDCVYELLILFGVLLE